MGDFFSWIGRLAYDWWAVLMFAGFYAGLWLHMQVIVWQADAPRRRLERTYGKDSAERIETAAREAFLRRVECSGC